MDNTTIFYIAGGALVALALGTAAIGIRNKDFPSPIAMRACTLVFAVLVAVTATFALLNARDEQTTRRAEQAVEHVQR